MAGHWTAPAGRARARWRHVSRWRVRSAAAGTACSRAPPTPRGTPGTLRCPPWIRRSTGPRSSRTCPTRRARHWARPVRHRNGTPTCCPRPTSITADRQQHPAHEGRAMNRREFLLAAASAAVALPTLSFSGRLFATPANSPRFLLVFLRGGYDCNNLLVPYASDFYYESRPTLAIARPDASNPNSAIALDANWGLNPVLRDSIYPLWQKKQIAFVPFAGTDDLSRSHFETQNNIESGEPTAQRASFRSGFLARLSGQLTGVPAIAFTKNLPLSFQGAGKDIPNISLKADPRAQFNARQAAILSGMYKNTPLAAATADGLALPATISGDLRNEMIKASRGAPSARSFATETQRIATLMRDQYRLGFVDVGGWDT